MNKFLKQFNPAIIVMAKVPQIGMVKTRLQPFLSAQQCVELAICFMKDTISNAMQITENVIVAYSPTELKTEAEALISGDIILIEQYGNDLGERLYSSFLNAENLGFSPLITIGTDSPTLPLSILQKSFDSFQNPENDLVLGAAEDGGYYLVGLRKANIGIFSEISWSSEKVFEETLEKARLLKLKYLTKLQTWYDIDLPADLMRLRNEILNDEGLQKRLSQTAQWLRANDKLFGE